MRAILAMLAATAALAACSHGNSTHKIDAILDADMVAARATITCRASSSGECHALFLSGGKAIAVSAEVGREASADGVTQGSFYCLDVTAPDAAKCKPKALAEGQQIIRNETVAKD